MKRMIFPMEIDSSAYIAKVRFRSVCVLAAMLLAIAASCTSSTEQVLPTLVPSENSVRPSPISSVPATPTLLSVASHGTPTITNSAVLTVIATTPESSFSTELAANETGLTPGQSTEQDVLARLGKPRANRGNDWAYGTPLVFNVTSVHFLQGVLQEMILTVPSDAAAESILAQLGPPELVVFFPQPDRPTSTIPVTEPPLGPPSVELIYASRGVLFHLVCNEAALRTCPGVFRKAPIYYKKYFVPLSIGAWVAQQLPYPSFYIRTWSGFSD